MAAGYVVIIKGRISFNFYVPVSGRIKDMAAGYGTDVAIKKEYPTKHAAWSFETEIRNFLRHEEPNVQFFRLWKT